MNGEEWHPGNKALQRLIKGDVLVDKGTLGIKRGMQHRQDQDQDQDQDQGWQVGNFETMSVAPELQYC
ncbi:hypothetical protein [Pseudomonas sp. NFPP17]|uniref:hypothetical protein n=1 Tax=unclassified Pseudomonas TaxID=196821 RepID=UPI0031F2D66F